jgi:hypothetical protein
MQGRVAFGLVVAMLVATAATAEERRQLQAHEHGHSALDIALEGGRVVMELAAPGADIVGFEHEATTEVEQAAIAAAKAALAEPLALFILPPAAGCKVAEAAIELDTAEGHAGFHADYTLNCANPAALGSINFAFFDRFPNAQVIKVRLASEHGQASWEVERAAPHLALDEVG